MSDNNDDPESTNGIRKRSNALQQGPRKKAYVFYIYFTAGLFFNSLCRCITDPLVHHGRHFCRTVHALCNVQALLTNGVLRTVELADMPEENFTTEYVTLLVYCTC
jgi:hypothetical protein